jgi:hypothetical protein
MGEFKLRYKFIVSDESVLQCTFAFHVVLLLSFILKPVSLKKTFSFSQVVRLFFLRFSSGENERKRVESQEAKMEFPQVVRSYRKQQRENAKCLCVARGRNNSKITSFIYGSLSARLAYVLAAFYMLTDCEAKITVAGDATPNNVSIFSAVS